MNANEQSDLIKATEAARILDVALQTLYRMTWKGQVSRVPFGGQFRWKRSECLAYRRGGAPSNNATEQSKE